MNYRPFGRTGLTVSCIGFGAGHIGSDKMEDASVDRLLNAVLDAGVNLIDTARGYGRSEERIGRFLSHRRSDFVLSTKIGYGVDGLTDWSAEIIPAGVTQALGLLRTGYLDIVHLHSCPVSVLQNEELLSALVREKESGRVKAIAYSGENDGLKYAIGTGIFDSIQLSVNIADQRSISEFLPRCEKSGMGVIAKRPLANCAWQYKDRPVGSYAETYWERLKIMAYHPAGSDWNELALRFVLSVPGVNSCIIGTGNMDHLLANIKAAEQGRLSDAEYRGIRDAFDRCDNGWVGQV